MFDYLQQFNSLPKDLKDKVSSPQAMTALAELENRYQVDLAMIVMKVMIKSLAIKDLPAIFVGEFSLSALQAEALAKELKEKIFITVSDYVGLTSEMKELDLNKDINLLIKEAGLTIPSEFLIERLKKIIAIYLKGVRSRVDTKESLAKDIATGGLGLSVEETDRILKVCDSQKFKYQDNVRPFSSSSPPGSRLDKIISANNKVGAAPLVEYDFKKALASGEIKRLSSPEEKGDAVVDEKKEGQLVPVAQKETSLGVLETESATTKGASVDDSTSSKGPSSTDQSLSQVKDESVNLIDSQEETGRADSQVVDNVADNKNVWSGPGIVRKPENTGLFKKLFNEEQKQASPGAVKFAVVSKNSDIQPSSASLLSASSNIKAGQQVQDKASKPSPLTVGALGGASVASARLGTNVNIAPPARNQAESLNRQSTIAMNRSRVQDVRVVPKVMGPLEELQFLDLTNFRRLGKSPEEITMKIFNKIKLLEKEGYDKMIAGIVAWKKSPVSLLYLKMVQEAINSGKTLKESVTLRQEKQRDVLTMAEIEAIMSFNSKLVF